MRGFDRSREDKESAFEAYIDREEARNKADEPVLGPMVVSICGDLMEIQIMPNGDLWERHAVGVGWGCAKPGGVTAIIALHYALLHERWRKVCDAELEQRQLISKMAARPEEAGKLAAAFFDGYQPPHLRAPLSSNEVTPCPCWKDRPDQPGSWAFWSESTGWGFVANMGQDDVDEWAEVPDIRWYGPILSPPLPTEGEAR